MAGAVQEVRAKFSATAQTFLNAIRDIRNNLGTLGNTSQQAFSSASAAGNHFESVMNQIRQASIALGNNNGLNRLELALAAARQEFQQTGAVSQATLDRIQQEINQTTHEVNQMGNVSSTSMHQFETAINGAQAELFQLQHSNFSSLIANINQSTSNMNQFGNEANQAGNQAQNALNQASQSANHLQSEMNQATAAARAADGMFSRLRGTVMSYVAAYLGFDMMIQGVKGVGRAMIMGNADMETYHNTLTTLLKSEEEAVKTLEWATKFAAETPFEIPEIIDATAKLTAYGIKASDVMVDLGNMAAIMGKPLDQAIEAVADAQTGELERLKEFGITKQMLIDKAAELGKKEVVNAKGQITDMAGMNEALFAIMKDRYDGGMDIASKSFKGIVSNIQDGMGTMARELGKPLFDGLKKQLQDLAPIVGAVTSIIQGNWKAAQKELLEAFGPEKALRIENFFLLILYWINETKQWFQRLEPTITNLGIIFSNVMEFVGPVFGAIVAGIMEIVKVTPTVLEYISGVVAAFSEWEGFVPLISGIVAALVTYKTIMTGIGVATKAFNIIQKASIVLYNAHRAAVIAWGIAGGGVQGVMMALRAAMTVLNLTFLANPIVLVISALVGLGVALVVAYKKSETFRNIVDKAWEGIKKGWAAVLDFFTETIPKWWENIVQWFGKMWDWVKGFFSKWGVEILAVVAPFIGIPLLIAKHWDSIKEFFSNLWKTIVQGISDFISSVGQWFANMGTTIANFFTNLWNSITSGISSFVSGVVDWFKSMGTSVGNAVSPFVETVKNYFVNLFNNIMYLIEPFVNFFIQSWENLKLFVLGIAGVFTSLLVMDFEGMKLGLMAIWEAIKRQFINVWETIKEFGLRLFELLKSGVINIATAIADGAIAAWNWLKDTSVEIFTAVKDWIVNTWTALKDGVVNGAIALKDGAVAAWNGLKDTSISVYTAVKDWIINTWNSLKTGVINGAIALKDGAINAWNALKQGAIDAVTNLYNGAINLFNNLKTGASNAVTNTKNAIVDGFNNAKNTAISTVTNMYNEVVSWFTKIPTKAKESGDNIVKTFKGINLLQIGKDIMNGLWNGISSGAQAVYNKAKEIADNIKNKIKKALDINSPSRVMAGFGVNIGEGLRNGMDSMIGKVGNMAGNMASAVTDNMNLSGVLGGAMDGAATIDSQMTLKHVIDLVNVPEGIDEDTLLQALLGLFKNPTVKRTIDRIQNENDFGYNRILGAN